MALVVCGGTTLISKFSTAATTAASDAAATAEGAISAVEVVQAFGVANILAQEHLQLLLRAFAPGVRKAIAGAAMLGSVYFVAYAANALAFWQGSRMIANDEGSGGAGTIYAVVFLILDASFVIGSFGPFLQTFALAASAGGRVFELIDHPEADINVYSDGGLPTTAEELAQNIKFEHVSFVYPARPCVRVLDGINLQIIAGTVTGVVGASGGGKSTLAALLLRFYDPCSGKITIGDHDLRDFHIASLRQQIALVDQDPILLAGTIMENISHGIPEKADLCEKDIRERCIRAAREANAHDFITALPLGFLTEVGPSGGARLSGGQKQRICLARAFVRDPKLLILDEPTSDLDAKSEALVVEALFRTAQYSGRTTLMIAHRLSTVKACDDIMVVGAGEVLEHGTHDELMSRDGPYQALVKAQRIEADPDALEGSVAGPSKETTETKRKAHLITAEEPEKDPADAASTPDSTSSTWRSFVRCLSLSRQERPLAILGVLASFITGSIITGEAIIFGNLINVLKQSDDSTRLLREARSYCVMFFGLALVAFCAYLTSGVCFGIVSERLIMRTKDISLQTIFRQDLEWFHESGHSASALMSSMTMDSGHLSGLSGVIIGMIFSVTASIVGGIILAHVVAWKIAIVLLAAVPVMVVAGYLRLRVLALFEQRHESAYSGAAALASEACTSIRTIAALGREKYVLELYKKKLEKPYQESLRFIAIGNLFLALALAITYFVYSLAYWWGSKLVRSGEYSVLQFFIVLPALLFSAQAAGQMFSVAPEITRAKAAASSVFALHDQKPRIMPMCTSSEKLIEPAAKESSVASSSSSGSGLLLKRPGTKIEFRDVTLTYSSRQEVDVLKQLNLVIHRGQFVAFVGPSGAGKSSTIGLLERFYVPSSGQILFDGKDIAEMPVEQHRERIALVSQSPDLFAGSVAFNVGLGARKGQTVAQEDIESACRRCGVHEFIMSLPDSYNTPCGLNGSQLSGGQKQRIAIARALIRDPEILLLDEATSALDAHSEIAIQEAVMAEAAASGRTTVLIAHRLSSVQKASKIFVLSQGCVVEEGTHEELVALGRVYASMPVRL
ncbi:MAG: hypothetical protein M1817_005272 [Caeruleum heppii]|nr:MAG: hypothetical protein M1817_005272 [Caeruleum heppii]